MKITLTQLEYITAVDTHRNFVKAAENCHVTQPTLSMQIQKLEDQFGIKIFDRSRLPVVPTQIGEEVIQQARVVLNETAKIEELINLMKGEVKGELKVGIIPTLAPYLVPMFAPVIVKKYHDLSISIVEANTKELTEQLKSEQIDCAIMSGPIANEEDFFSKNLFYEGFVAYTHPASQYAAKNSLSIQDIKASDVWLLSEGHCLRTQVEEMTKYKTFVINSRIEYESNSLYSLIRMVDRNGGLTILPKLAVRDLSEKRRLNVRTFISPIPSREIKLYTHRAYPKQKLLSILEDAIHEVLPESTSSPRDRKILPGHIFL